MHAHDDRDQFAPPAPPARLRAISLAVLVHLALIGALTWGVNWKASSDQPAVQAELWSAVPQQAAPPEVTPPTPPTPPQPPEPRPAPTPAPPPPPPPPPRAVEPDTREADIAIEREKKRLEQEKKARAEKLEREKRERERKEEEREERLEREKKEKLAEQKKAEQEKERQKKLAEEKRKAEEAKEAKEAAAKKQQRAEAEAKQLAAQREANLRRMQGLAGSEGNERSTGTAQRDSGPSGSYGGRVAAKVKPNIVYPDAISGNPRAEVEVRLAPDGTIVGKRLVQSSGNKAWDEAVLRALEKTETLPRDVDGRVPPSLTIGFRPQD
ncbi:colicin import membrane protein [Acidovorax soli]|uniref:Colicin import membrane protein n=1 Tax=Acidovorax soli TaxID=592050 RepID=A0A7X0PJY1_9BURK|nr:cell envelope integrity protein TolA [Acidovorax soli]MBB6562984.1 colicin import membrane protein [Acidovorax soli]